MPLGTWVVGLASLPELPRASPGLPVAPSRQITAKPGSRRAGLRSEQDGWSRSQGSGACQAVTGADGACPQGCAQVPRQGARGGGGRIARGHGGPRCRLCHPSVRTSRNARPPLHPCPLKPPRPPTWASHLPGSRERGARPSCWWPLCRDGAEGRQSGTPRFCLVGGPSLEGTSVPCSIPPPPPCTSARLSGHPGWAGHPFLTFLRAHGCLGARGFRGAG